MRRLRRRPRKPDLRGMITLSGNQSDGSVTGDRSIGRHNSHSPLISAVLMGTHVLRTSRSLHLKGMSVSLHCSLSLFPAISATFV
jgi:hypothetical protein